MSKGLQVYRGAAGDDFMKFVLNTSRSKWELWPLWGCLGFWSGIFTAIVYHSFMKTEIYLNRANSVQPWEWSRAKNEFEKRKHLFDYNQHWKRIPELDRLQEEMAQVEKQEKKHH